MTSFWNWSRPELSLPKSFYCWRLFFLVSELLLVSLTRDDYCPMHPWVIGASVVVSSIDCEGDFEGSCGTGRIHGS